MLVSAILGLVTISCTLSLAGPTDDTKYHTSVKLNQHGRMIGDVTAYLAPNGLRVENKRSQVVLIAKAPSWEIYKFCAPMKRYTQEPFKGFMTKLNKTHALFGGIVMMNATATKVGASQVFGLNSEDYKEDQKHVQKALDMYFKSHLVNGDYPRAFTYRILDPALFPPEEAHIMSVLHAIPDFKGIPVTMRCVSLESKTYNFLTTSSIDKAAIDKSQFDLPTGMKKVEQESQLTTDKETESALINLVEP